MLLTITTTHKPATDLGYLLVKHPARLQRFPLTFGQAHVFYPEASPERCTAALAVEVDPVALVRGRQGRAGERGVLEQYVNDRPYAASSLLSVAIAEVFTSALAGRSKGREALAGTPIPLSASMPVLPSRGGERLLRRLFEPLGYTVTASPLPLDSRFPDWGDSPYFSVTVEGRQRLQDLLAHLYVLVPVLDDDKHYWVGDAEVEKLLRHGEGWLSGHPERGLITSRYLKHQRHLTRAALARLVEEELGDPDGEEARRDREEEAVEARIRLDDQRLGAVVAVLRAAGAARVVDLGCGEGRLLAALLGDPRFETIVGLDVSVRALERARDRLGIDRLAPRQRQRISLLHGSLTYRDARLAGYDAATLVEVIEHLDPPRLAALERVVFEAARPRTVVVTTPNVEYNVRFEGLPAGRLRHRDHRFEWTRAEFRAWTERVCSRFGYDVRLLPIGPEDADLGPPTQMAVFSSNATRLDAR